MKSKAQVAFKLEDTLCPDQELIFSHLGGEVEVVGSVVFLSDSATQESEFAIVEVPGIAVPLIVPREKLRMITMGERGEKRKEVAESLEDCC